MIKGTRDVVPVELRGIDLYQLPNLHVVRERLRWTASGILEYVRVTSPPFCCYITEHQGSKRDYRLWRTPRLIICSLSQCRELREQRSCIDTPPHFLQKVGVVVQQNEDVGVSDILCFQQGCQGLLVERFGLFVSAPVRVEEREVVQAIGNAGMSGFQNLLPDL